MVRESLRTREPRFAPDGLLLECGSSQGVRQQAGLVFPQREQRFVARVGGNGQFAQLYGRIAYRVGGHLAGGDRVEVIPDSNGARNERVVLDESGRLEPRSHVDVEDLQSPMADLEDSRVVRATPGPGIEISSEDGDGQDLLGREK